MKEYPFLRNFGSLIQSLLDTCDDIDTFAATELKKTEDVRQEFRYDGEETLKKMIEKVETYISNGFKVYEKLVGNMNESLIDIFDTLVDEGNFEIIYRDD